MKLPYMLFLAAIGLTIRLSAQEAPKVKFEKVSEEELSMKTYPADTTADAVILFDDGSSYIKYDLEKGFMLTYERFVRIKILKQNGIDWGNFHFSLYSNANNKEEISHVKGTTMNLENGKIVKTDLKKSAIFKERENKYYDAVRLSMPAVKVGSIIDLQYTIWTDLVWNLRNWKFQYTIPVKWSQYRVTYPEYFTYNQQFVGYHMLLYNKKSESDEHIAYTEKIEDNSSNGYSNGGRQSVIRNITYRTQTFEYAANDVPALKTEPYLTDLDNFTSQLKFELANTNYSKIGGSFHNYTTSWKEIATQLSNDENFGTQLNGNGFLDDDVELLTKGLQSEEAKLAVLYSTVQKSMKWDGYKAMFTDKSLKKTYTEKTGNSADINLLLVAMLRKAGISAFPVILSTRDNGILSMSHPSISDCNYVIVKATASGKDILLDATEPSLQAGIVPFRCLNGEGHLIGKVDSEVVPISNPKSGESVAIELSLKDGKLGGTFQKRLTGLSAFDFRKSIKSAGGKKEFYDKLKDNSTEVDYLNYTYDNTDSLNLPLVVAYKFDLKEKQEGDAAILYIDPIIFERQKTNPFTATSRIYPVDFGIPITQYYNMQFTIPEGYTVEEVPKNISYALDGRGCQFQYQVTQIDQKILVTMALFVNKTLFLPSEYPSLRNFFDLVINKQAEQLVLKKKTT